MLRLLKKTSAHETDVILNTKVKDAKDIKVGDVITFISTSSISKGMTITHRVIEVTKNENGVAYRTKGDNNISPFFNFF